MISPADANRLLPALSKIVAQASAVILSLEAGSLERRLKDDRSPVTIADEASEAEILKGIARLVPDLPVVSEETFSRGVAPKLGRSFAMVDPLDGTKEFLAGTDEFTVNLALITDGVPIAGIIAAPKRGQLWRGVIGHGAERLRLTADDAVEPQPIRTRRWPAQGAATVISRSHLDPATQAFVAGLGALIQRQRGSALKFCLIADGDADVYPRLSTTCEWDVAAGHAIVTAAGGLVTDAHGAALRYGCAAENFRVPAFIAWGDAERAVRR